MKYNKPTVSAKVKTLMNYEVTFTDGKGAVTAFKDKETLKGESGDSTILIPFHAVKTLTETWSTTEAEKGELCVSGESSDNTDNTDPTPEP